MDFTQPGTLLALQSVLPQEMGLYTTSHTFEHTEMFFFISSKFLPFQINNEKNNTVRIWLKVCDHMKILFLIYSHFGVIITSTLLVKLSLEGVNLI